MKGMCLALVAVTSISAPAWAEDDRGFYGSLRVGVQTTSDIGYNFTVDEYGTSDVDLWTSLNDTLTSKIKVKSNPEFTGVIGYDFGPVRTDIELGFGKSSFSTWTFTSVNGAPLTAAQAADICSGISELSCSTTGNVAKFDIKTSNMRRISAMASVWLDIPVKAGLQPYVGGGLGFTSIRYEDSGEKFGSHTAFSWQVGGGLIVPVGKRISLSADYRFRHTQGGTHGGAWTDGKGIDAIKSHQFSVGLAVKL